MLCAFNPLAVRVLPQRKSYSKHTLLCQEPIPRNCWDSKDLLLFEELQTKSKSH